MKRKDIIKKLIKEGFSVKTLLNMPDNQINLLSCRILGEQEDTENVTNVPKTDRIGIDKLKNSKKKFVTYEGELPENEEENDNIGIKAGVGWDKNMEEEKEVKKKKVKKEVKEWVEQLVQPETSVTTKNEIMELIDLRLKEQFMDPEPEVAEPEVKPGVGEPEAPDQAPNKEPYHDPWKKPGKGPDPRPKFQSNDGGGEIGGDELPDFLTFNSIISSVNERNNVSDIVKRVLKEIKTSKRK